MNRNLPLVLILLLLATGCVTTIEPTAIPVSPNPTVAPQIQTANTPQLPPQGNCQSKLLGRVVDANGALAKGAVIEIKSGSFNAKALSDDNGLYGFAGLCAGGYGFTVTLPGKSPRALATTATLDGANTVKTDLAVK
jgi:carboxypeptidase family protein